MAINSADALLAGFKPGRFFYKAITPTLIAGKPQSLWGLGGVPGAGSFDTTLAGVALSAPQNGQIPFTNPSVGQETRLARFVAGNAAAAAGVLMLCDRLWHNGGFTITSNAAQTVNSATFPARDAAGTTNGDGVLLGLEISAAAGAAAPSVTVSYTNQAGSSGRTGSNLYPTANSPAAGSFFPIALQAGDTGVRSVQSLTLSASWLSGTMNLVAYRVLAVAEVGASGLAGGGDALSTGLPLLYDSSVPFLVFVPGNTTASRIFGHVAVAQG